MTSPLPTLRRILNQWTNRSASILSAVALAVLPAKAAGDEQPRVNPSIPSAETVLSLEDSEKLVAALVADSQKNKVTRDLDPADPLTQAEFFCANLGSDVEELGKHLRLVAMAYARQGRWKDAAYVARQVPGGTSALTEADLASEAIRSGNTDLARHHLELCRNNMIYCTGRQKDFAQLGEILTLHQLKDGERVAALRKELSPDILLEFLTEARVLEDGLYPTPDAVRKRMKEHALPAHIVARWAAMLAESRHKAGKTTEAHALLDLAGEISAPPASFAEQRGLLDVARAAKSLGEENLANKALNLYTASMLRLAAGNEEKPALLADGAAVLTECKRKEDAAKLMKVATEGAPQVFIYFAADAHLAVARGWLRLGETEKAQESLLSAAQVAAATDHPRPRNAAAVRICIFYAETKLSISPEVAAFLEKVKGT